MVVGDGRDVTGIGKGTTDAGPPVGPLLTGTRGSLITGIGKGTTNADGQSGGLLNGTRRPLIVGLGLGLGVGAENHSLLGVLSVIAALPSVRGAGPDPGLALLRGHPTDLVRAVRAAALGAVSSALFGATKEQLPDAREDG